MQHSEFLDNMHFASCKSHTDLGGVLVSVWISSLLSVIIDARTSSSLLVTDPICCAPPDSVWLCCTSVGTNVDSARILITIDVPRAMSGQLRGIWRRAVLDIVHVNVEYARVSVHLYSYHPFHGCAPYLAWSNPWRTQFVFTCWGVVSKDPASNGKSARHGLAVVVPFLVVCGSLLLRAPHHTPRTVLVEPIMHNRQYPEGGGGLCVVPCVASSPVGYTPRQILVYVV